MVEEERRRSVRYWVHGSISFTGNQVRGSGQIYNLSATGCAVGTPSQIPQGTWLRMSLQLGDVEPVIIETAVIRWVHQYTFGAEFLLADTAHVTRLGACLHGFHKNDLGQP
jgi:hypothetical protein